MLISSVTSQSKSVSGKLAMNSIQAHETCRWAGRVQAGIMGFSSSVVAAEPGESAHGAFLRPTDGRSEQSKACDASCQCSVVVCLID